MRLALIFLAIGSVAQAGENPRGLCEAFGKNSEAIMLARQNGVAMSEVMAVAEKQKAENEVLGEVMINATITAYDRPRFNSKKYQQKAIEDFRDEAFLSCIKAFRKTKN